MSQIVRKPVILCSHCCKQLNGTKALLVQVTEEFNMYFDKQECVEKHNDWRETLGLERLGYSVQAYIS